MRKPKWPKAVKKSRWPIYSDSLRPADLTRGEECQLVGLVRNLKYSRRRMEKRVGHASILRP
jgi:hypothetical protein